MIVPLMQFYQTLKGQSSTEVKHTRYMYNTPPYWDIVQLHSSKNIFLQTVLRPEWMLISWFVRSQLVWISAVLRQDICEDYSK